MTFGEMTGQDDRQQQDNSPEGVASEDRLHADLMREIFGNATSPIVADSACRTPAVLAMAAKMYAEDDFSGIANLADALESANCRDGE
jgi:hypothetical protein